MAGVNLSKKPKFARIKAGVQTLKIVSVENFPNRKNTPATKVTVQFVDADGVKLSKNGNPYDLTNDGGYAAFFYLVEACGFEPDETFDTSDLVGCFVECEVTHNSKDYPKKDGEGEIIEGEFVTVTFANITKTLGVGTPFSLDNDETPAPAVAADDDDLDDLD